MSKLLFFVYSDDAEVRSNVSNALRATGRVELVAAPSVPQSLDEILSTAQIDGLYVDLGSEPTQLLKLLESASSPRPNLLLGGSETDPSVLVRAMRLQPLDFLVDHDVSNLAANVERIASQGARRTARRQERRAAIAIVGSKGGVGATFVGCELASSLQQLGDRVVVIDLNLRLGDAALYFDLKPPYTLADVAKKGDALDKTFLETAIATHLCGVRVLAGPSEVQDVGMIGAGHIERAFQLLREDFEWIVLDLPRAWDDVCLRALNLVDHIILVTNTDVPSLRHTKLQLELLERFGAPDDQVRVVVNRFGRTSTLTEKEISEFLEREPDLLIPADDNVVSKCVNEGKLLRDVGRGGKVEESIRRLADLSCEWVLGENARSRQRPSFLTRMRQYVARS